jgi:hypothetical protein
MKQKDFVLIAVMVFLSVIVSLVISRLIFSSPKSRNQTAEVVDLITPEFPDAPKQYFNKDSVNPTEHIVLEQPDDAADKAKESAQ